MRLHSSIPKNVKRKLTKKIDRACNYLCQSKHLSSNKYLCNTGKKSTNKRVSSCLGNLSIIQRSRLKKVSNNHLIIFRVGILWWKTKASGYQLMESGFAYMYVVVAALPFSFWIHSPRWAGTLPACSSLFQLILSHRILFNHPKPSKNHYWMHQPNTTNILSAV